MKELAKGQYSGNKIAEVENTLFTTSVTCYTPESFDNTRHSHPNAHLSFVLKGGCEEQKSDKYERGLLSSTFYHRDEPHQINMMSKNSIHLNIDFDPLFIQQINTENTIELITKKDFSLPLEMMQLYKELYTKDDVKPLAIEEAVLGMFSTDKSSSLYKTPPLWVEQIKQYLQEYWDKSITLEELSQITGLHKISISKHFSKFTGCTISTYQRKLRVYHALELINNGQQSLSQIALQCGFADQSHFIRFFKQYTGFLPKKFEQL